MGEAGRSVQDHPWLPQLAQTQGQSGIEETFTNKQKIAELAMRLSGRDQAYLTADPGFNSQKNKERNVGNKGGRGNGG